MRGIEAGPTIYLTHLKLGAGYPWAGHKIDRLECPGTTKGLDCKGGTFGAVLETGSTKTE